MEINLSEITIKYYCEILRAGKDKEKAEAINKALISEINILPSVQNIGLFLTQKDLFIFQCKLAKAIIEKDEEKIRIFDGKVKKLSEEIKSKTSRKKEEHPYKVFLSWILSVEKFLSFSIDKNNDLIYFVEATKQMLNYYDSQKKAIEANSVKK